MLRDKIAKEIWGKEHNSNSTVVKYSHYPKEKSLNVAATPDAGIDKIARVITL
jgi:hypothetical protein